MKKVAFYTLGCKVNQYETEAMLEMFKKEGYTQVDSEDFADVYVINTCTVTHMTDRKSRQYIRRMKKKNPNAIIAVVGCYSQVSPEEILDIEEVNLVMGTNERRQIVEEIKKIGIVPVVVLDDAKDAEPLAKALCEGGLPCAEVTFRTEAAEESIRIISEKYPEMLVGAGTVLTTEQVDRAVAAGAKFIVSPGFNPKIVKYCIDRDIPVTPGTQTPSEMEQAIEMGLDVVKFFPAEPAGGLKMIKAVAAPYTMLQFMPTGGINLNNVEEYLEYDRILACGGSWMVKGDLVKAGKFDEIQKMTADAAALVKKIRG